jgi:tetratricopeptide (TPR) repeat protein
LQKLGQSLFLVSALESRPLGVPAEEMQPQAPDADNPRVRAEAILAAVRHAGDRKKEATALTDLGALALSVGDSKAAITSLENALAITRELGDQTQESDIISNLGMAMLAVRQPERAHAMFERALAHARATSDRFAEKVALERLGLAAWTVRDFAGALRLFDTALALSRQLGDRHQEASLLWHQGIQHAELGERESAIAKAEEAIALYRSMGRPEAASYGAYLQKYRMNLFDDSSVAAAEGVAVDRSPGAYLGGSIVASVMAGQPSAVAGATKPTSGPGLLRMAMSATKAMAGFVGSGFKTVPPETQRKRLQTCAACEHHTGVRCKICGCFTSVKSRLVHEDCPIGKWPT